MKRWVCFFLCLLLSVAMLCSAWLLPVYFRAVDPSVLQRAGKSTTSLVDAGLAAIQQRAFGKAELMWLAAQPEKIAGHDTLFSELKNTSRTPPEALLGMNPSLKTLLDFTDGAATGGQRTKPFTELIVQFENRKSALGLLWTSSDPTIQVMMQTRSLTNTVLFSPSESSSGQAFDAALCIGGLLLEGGHLSSGLSEEILSTASTALRDGKPQPFEQILMDFMSLGQRLNWGQLIAFCEQIEDAETLRLLTNLARKDDEQLPVIFSGVTLSGKPAEIANYLSKFGESGPKDLAASLHFGAGGVSELVNRNLRLQTSGSMRPWAADLCWRKPMVALSLKWSMYLAAGFLLLSAVKSAGRKSGTPGRSIGLMVVRDTVFALGFAVVVLLLSEPFLTQVSQNVEFPIRFQLPTMGSGVTNGSPSDNRSIMNYTSLFTLLLFFVIQALIYIACLVKLSEIRRQNLASGIKLKLLENEDHLFDAGLYIGFAGTIISLIMVSMGVIKPSLMAAYSSTSFGVIFVSIFKIFHLRPYRRNLLLDAEAAKTLQTAAPQNNVVAPL